MEIWSLWKNKTGILSKWSQVSTTEWLHHLRFNETPWEKARCELQKNAAWWFEQILEAASYKAAAVQSLTSHLINDPYKKRKRYAGHVWGSKDEFISDVLLWTPAYGHINVDRPAKTYNHQLCADTGCRQKITKSDGWSGRMTNGERESRKFVLLLLLLLLMMMIHNKILVHLF